MEFGRVGSFVTIYGEETFMNTELLSVGRSRPRADGEGRVYTPCPSVGVGKRLALELVSVFC